ncbi:unnamed protein product [Brachionus calyciflorus]|uniref:ISXO2-like transposase domain-containing protein n=1 Tax=Brachionus calyciflorus TaxID=104777 RepID=A0A813RLW2_9BILA|nr:unnamed protein product [Brachionus calyciflorus]
MINQLIVRCFPAELTENQILDFIDVEIIRFAMEYEDPEGPWVQEMETAQSLEAIVVYMEIDMEIKKAAFLEKFYSNQAKIETSCFDNREELTSENTLSDCYNYCTELCMSSMDQLYDRVGKIGDPGHVVEIESKVDKRKYNVSRIFEVSWILGMTDLGTNESPNAESEFNLEICPENSRDGETLLALINKHVSKGSTIITDCWKIYNGLENDGFEHLRVNHNYNFVDQNTYAHTQTIESNWRPLKKLLKTGVRKENLALHMCEY